MSTLPMDLIFIFDSQLRPFTVLILEALSSFL